MPVVPSGLSAWRWRLMLWRTRAEPVRFLYWAPGAPAAHRQIRMFDRDGYDVGQLQWRICDACQLGSIQKISIIDDHQQRGLGRRVTAWAVAQAPTFAWRTSTQSPEGSRFFAALRRDTGYAFDPDIASCQHFEIRAGGPPLPRPRTPPVLLRDL